jgi:hypothetical protein
MINSAYARAFTKGFQEGYGGKSFGSSAYWKASVYCVVLKCTVH